MDSFLKNNNVPGIRGVDTRYLTRKLSKYGAKKIGLINFGEEKKSFDNLNKLILRKIPEEWKNYNSR